MNILYTIVPSPSHDQQAPRYETPENLEVNYKQSKLHLSLLVPVFVDGRLLLDIPLFRVGLHRKDFSDKEKSA